MIPTSEIKPVLGCSKTPTITKIMTVVRWLQFIPSVSVQLYAYIYVYTVYIIEYML